MPSIAEDVAMGSAPLAAIFDNDGLLLDTEEAWTRAEQTLFAGLGREFTTEHKRTLIGSSRSLAAVKLEAILERPGEGEALMDELHELVMEEALQGVAPRPGALALLERLTRRRRPAGRRVELRARVPRAHALIGAGCSDGGPFAAIVSANDVEHPKPAPDIYLEACARLGVAPADAVALEDSPIGVAAAAAAGMFVIGVPYFAGSADPRREPARRQPRRRAVARALGLGELGGRAALGELGRQRAAAASIAPAPATAAASSARAARTLPPTRAARWRSQLSERGSPQRSRQPSSTRSSCSSSATVASTSTLPPPCSAGPRRTRYSSPVSLTQAARCSGSFGILAPPQADVALARGDPALVGRVEVASASHSAWLAVRRRGLRSGLSHAAPPEGRGGSLRDQASSLRLNAGLARQNSSPMAFGASLRRPEVAGPLGPVTSGDRAEAISR